jgi:hypothetical protein
MHYRKIWETANNKKIPDDYEIHHIDGNRNNNEPKNLKCVSIQEHLEIHKKQKDWGAVAAILMRLNNIDPILHSQFASKHQLNLLKAGRHNFQKISLAEKSKRSAAIMEKRLNDHGVAFLGITDPVENGRKAGKMAALKSAGFLNTQSKNHGSKHVKNTVWWINVESGARKRAVECPGENWKRGMSK